MTVRQLLDCTTSAELAEQMAYDLMRRQQADEAEQQAALNQTVQQGMSSITHEIKRKGRR